MGITLAFEVQRFHFLLHTWMGMMKAFVMQLFNIIGSEREFDQVGHQSKSSPLFLALGKSKIYTLAKYKLSKNSNHEWF